MRTLCVVQARTGSTRLPGKVLADLAGRPMLRFMLDRLARLAVDELVVATSDLPGDDAVASVADDAGVPVVRGPEQDVLARFVLALDRHPADRVVRLTADCPLIDPELVTDAVVLLDDADYASNALVRTYPDGLDVEVLTAAALRNAHAEATDPVEREHVTPFVYRRTSRYRLVALRTDELLGDERWTVDTSEDIDNIRALVARLDDPVGATWTDMLAVAGRRFRPEPGALHLRPAIAGDPGFDPATAADPSVRTWVAELDATPVGVVGAVVVDGRAAVTADVPEAHAAVAVQQAEAALGLQAFVSRPARPT